MKLEILERELQKVAKIKENELGIVDETASHNFFLKLQIESFISFIFYIIVLITNVIYYYIETNTPTTSTISRSWTNSKILLALMTLFNSFCCKLLNKKNSLFYDNFLFSSS